jgi:hypothetical protein
MNDFKVEILGLDYLLKALKDYPSFSEPILQKSVDASAAILAKHTLKGDPVPWRTGNLLHSFRHQSTRLQARWYPTAKYAPFVEFGRGEVVPIKAMALSWKNVGGDRVFAKRSRPAAARPFMQAIVDNSKSEIEEVFAKSLSTICLTIANLTKR